MSIDQIIDDDGAKDLALVTVGGVCHLHNVSCGSKCVMEDDDMNLNENQKFLHDSWNTLMKDQSEEDLNPSDLEESHIEPPGLILIRCKNKKKKIKFPSGYITCYK
ncbi:hypothetical protein RYX36_014736, partial [Vicia faba]